VGCKGKVGTGKAKESLCTLFSAPTLSLNSPDPIVPQLFRQQPLPLTESAASTGRLVISQGPLKLRLSVQFITFEGHLAAASSPQLGWGLGNGQVLGSVAALPPSCCLGFGLLLVCCGCGCAARATRGWLAARRRWAGVILPLLLLLLLLLPLLAGWLAGWLAAAAVVVAAAAGWLAAAAVVAAAAAGWVAGWLGGRCYCCCCCRCCCCCYCCCCCCCCCRCRCRRP